MKKQPKLIVLSGPPAIGKSTLAQMYIDRHPMTLNIDIDKIWFMMGQWQESRPHSHEQKMRLSYVLAEEHLKQGYDVVVAQDIEKSEYYAELEKISRTSRSKLIEITLLCPVEEAIKRCIQRGKRIGHKSGFRPGGVLDTEGREEKLRLMYKEMMNASNSRPKMHFVEVEAGKVKQTYEAIISIVGE